MVYRPLWQKNGPYAYVGFEMKNLFNFTFLLVDFGKVLCLSATSSSKTQMLLEKNIFRRYCLFFLLIHLSFRVQLLEAWLALTSV